MSKRIIYQTLPRLWGGGKLRDWDAESLAYLRSLGVDYVWYTGIPRHATGKDFVKGNPGSPYAITDWRDVNPYLADDPARRLQEFDALVDKLVEYEPDPAESPAIILHADAEEDARELKELALKKFPDLKIRIDNVGPVIGAHCGPGTLAITFLGKERKY